MNIFRKLTSLAAVVLLCLLPISGQAQIHILHINGTLVNKTNPSISDSEIISVFDQGFMIIALDYDRLTVTISKSDAAPKIYAITTITQLPEGLDCAFMDQITAVVYSLKVVYLHVIEGKPVLGISWNDGKDSGEEYVLWSEDVTLY